MIVVDTNLVAYLLIEGEQTRPAEAVLLKDPVWAAPILWRSEFRNLLLQYLRRQHLELPAAVRYMEEAEALFTGREYDVKSSSVLELAQRSGCTAYDCEFVYLARELDAPLVTSDKNVLAAFPDVAFSPEVFAE